MTLPRREFLRLAGAAAALPAAARLAFAQAYPARQVRFVIGFPPGGPTDLIGRLIGQWLSERLGQPVVIENRPGAGGNIATQSVISAPADGHTLLLVSHANAINASLYDRLAFNFIRDIAPVAGLAQAPNVLEVVPSLPATTVAEFVAYAKANPGKLTYASAGNGTSAHLAAELFKAMTGVDLLHVPYRGSGPALTDMLGGQVQIMFDSLPSSIEHIKAGKLRALAVTTAQRSEALPDLPTIAETVPGYDASGWFGVGVPAATPAPVVERLNGEINAGLRDARIATRFAELGASPMIVTPAAFTVFIADETEKWAKAVMFSGAKGD
jgi:tripartite-type tricarboxylate transporter receptor subunit TctC